MINRHWLIFDAGNAGVYQGLYHNRHMRAAAIALNITLFLICIFYKTQPDAKLRERESRNRNRNRQRILTLMLIFSSTERPSQGLGGQLGDPGARAIQVV